MQAANIGGDRYRAVNDREGRETRGWIAQRHERSCLTVTPETYIGPTGLFDQPAPLGAHDSQLLRGRELSAGLATLSVEKRSDQPTACRRHVDNGASSGREQCKPVCGPAFRQGSAYRVRYATVARGRQQEKAGPHRIMIGMKRDTPSHVSLSTRSSDWSQQWAAKGLRRTPITSDA